MKPSPYLLEQALSHLKPYAGWLGLAYQPSHPGDWIKPPAAKSWEPDVLRASVRDLLDKPALRASVRMRKLRSASS